MSTKKTTDLTDSNWRYRTRLCEPAHPLNDDRVSINTQINPKDTTETYRRADLSLENGEWQAWDSTDGIQRDGKLSNARTTFYVEDLSVKSPRVLNRYNEIWKLQMNRRHTWEDDPTRKTIVRDEAILKRCDALLQCCETPKWARKIALSKVHSTCLNGFNRHYKGTDGACLGFALLAMCDSPEEAKETLVAKRAAIRLPLEGMDREFVDRLINYVFRKYGDDGL